MERRQTSRARRRRLSREAAWLMFGQAAAVLGFVAGVRVLTELLTPAAYGELALGMAAAALLNQAALGPLALGAARFFAPAQEKKQSHTYLLAVKRLALTLSAALLACGVLGIVAIYAVSGARWLGLAAAALLFALLAGLSAVLSSLQNAARARALVALHQGAESWLRLVLAAGLLVALGASSSWAMFAYALASACVLASQYLFLRRSATHPDSGDASEDWRGRIRDYARPMAVFGIFTWAYAASDRWALELLASTREVGMFAALYQLGFFPMTFLANAATQFLAPIFFQRAGDASDARRVADVSRMSWSLTAVVLGASLAVFLLSLALHREIFQLLVASDYAGVSRLLPWMLLAGGIFAAGQTLALDLMSRLRTRAMLTVKIATALLGIALNVAGAYTLGIGGIVGAALAFSLSYFTWMALLAWRSGRTR